MIYQVYIITPFTCRAGVQARVRGEGEGAGQVLAQARLHRHEIPLRLPSASLYLQVQEAIIVYDPVYVRSLQ